jgi:hypothetical protein
MPEAKLRKVKADELNAIAKMLVNVAHNQGFVVNIRTHYDYEQQKYIEDIDISPAAQPIKREEPSHE